MSIERVDMDRENEICSIQSAWAKKYVFEAPGDVVGSMDTDIGWLLAELERERAETAALRERVRRLERSFDIAPGSWERLRSLLSTEHTHGDGMNECAICDEPLTDAASREIEGLRERIRLLEQGCVEFRRRLYEWSQAYPLDVFREPPYGEHGKTVDACSASMGRHVTRRLLEDFDECVPPLPESDPPARECAAVVDG